jgi:hypothetical protein
MTTRDVSTPAWILAALILTTPAGPGHASQEAAPAPGGIRDQFEIVLPEGWSTYDQTEAVTGKPAALAQAPDHTDIQVGGCRGVRYVLEANKREPAKHRVLDVRVVSDGKTLHLFSLRNKGVHYATNLAAFDAAMASVRFTSVLAK